jgi:hypothetical protein
MGQEELCILRRDGNIAQRRYIADIVPRKIISEKVIVLI